MSRDVFDELPRSSESLPSFLPYVGHDVFDVLPLDPQSPPLR